MPITDFASDVALALQVSPPVGGSQRETAVDAIDKLGIDLTAGNVKWYGAAVARQLVVDDTNTPWDLAVASDVVSGNVTMDAGAEVVTVITDLSDLVRAGGSRGIRVTKYRTFYTVGTADLTACELDLVKLTFPTVTGTAPTAADVTVTGTELLTQDDHMVERVVTTPAVIDGETEALQLHAKFTMANTGTLKYYGTLVYYDFGDA